MFKRRMELSPEEKELRKQYRLVFGSAAGRAVLADILQEFGFFDELVETPENLVSQNCARRILKKCGILTEANLSTLVDAMLHGRS